VDTKTGTYDVDSATFVGILLAAAAPHHLALVPRAGEKPYPEIHELLDFLQGKLPHGWHRIEKLAKARPGDVVAWRPVKATQAAGTGHVAIVAGRSELDANGEAWTLPVHDASENAHFEDSRDRGGKYHAGIGSGTLKLRADEGGAAVAVQAGPGAQFHKAAVVVVRLADLSEGKEKAPSHGPARSAEAHASASAPPAGGWGHRIERAAVANEVLERGEFAFATYALASTTSILLPATTIACWGPGQQIPQSLGQGTATYTLVGGVVFRNH
jgi:hypothetical protein